MKLFFANKNKLVPPRKEGGYTGVGSVTGKFMSYDEINGNNTAGCWAVFHLMNSNEVIKVYFDPYGITQEDKEMYDALKGYGVTLRSNNGRPVIYQESADSEETIRAHLVKGVAEGHLNPDELPALLEFAKGNDTMMEKWALFKQEIEEQGFSAVKERISKEIEDTKTAIEKERATLEKLKNILDEVTDEKRRVTKELNDSLIFLHGEESHNGWYWGTIRCYEQEGLVAIRDGYNSLIEAFEQFKTRKGIYVLCDGKLHLIHHAYLENKGRAFLIGTSKEYKGTKPEVINNILERL